MKAASSSIGAHSFSVARTIHATRQAVFDAFLAAEPLRKWFGPTGFETVTHDIDPRLGGLWRFTMRGPDGTAYPNWVRYVEFVPPERIVWDQGQDPNEPPWHRTTVTLEEAGESTIVTLHMVFPDAGALRRAVDEHHAVAGGKQTLARLASYVEGGAA